MRLLVTGGRHYTDREAVYDALDRVHAKRPVTLLIHGACPTGADSLADDWAALRGIERRPFYAMWRQYGPSAGPIRNRTMLADGKPDGVVAFPGNNGTADMVAIARAAGVTVWEPLS